MRALTPTLVIAQVRPAGTDRRHEYRTFSFMLCDLDPLDKQRKEAKRILTQIGYDSLHVNVPPQEITT